MSYSPILSGVPSGSASHKVNTKTMIVKISENRRTARSSARYVKQSMNAPSVGRKMIALSNQVNRTCRSERSNMVVSG